MQAHLVGGPSHGEDISITEPPQRSITTVEAPVSILSVDFGRRDSEPISFFPNWKEHTYRLLHHDARLAVYRWDAPVVDATWEFHVVIPRGRGYEVREKLDNLHETNAGKATRMVGWEFDEGSLRVRGVSRVDGPPDGVAVAEVSAEVQKIIDARFRGYVVSTVSVEVNGD